MKFSCEKAHLFDSRSVAFSILCLVQIFCMTRTAFASPGERVGSSSCRTAAAVRKAATAGLDDRTQLIYLENDSKKQSKIFRGDTPCGSEIIHSTSVNSAVFASRIDDT